MGIRGVTQSFSVVMTFEDQTLHEIIKQELGLMKKGHKQPYPILEG